jgi:hypothetical protein
MQILRRKHAAKIEVPQSLAMCQSRGCANHNALPCNYRDRRGRLCPAVFCPDHRISIGGLEYCRRHAGTIRALGDRGRERFGLPDLENRGPSLVNFIAADLDEHVRTLLSTVVRAGETVVTDGEVTQGFDGDRRPRWERSWKLVESTGPVLKVTVSVDEHLDPLVTVRVGMEMVAQGIPPWIEHRRKASDASEAEDQAERLQFNQFLEENITTAVQHLRERSDHPTWA